MELVEDDAIILKRHEFGENDVILSTLTRHSGAQRAMAKGIRKTSHRGHGSSSTGNIVAVRMRLGEGDRLGSLLDVELKESLSMLGGDLDGYYFVSYMCDVLHGPEFDSTTGEKLFRLYGAMLGAVNAHGFRPAFPAYFQAWAMKLEGVFPDVLHCASCGVGLDAEAGPVWVPESAEPACAACGPAPTPGRPGDDGRKLWCRFREIMRKPPSDFAQDDLPKSSWFTTVEGMNGKLSQMAEKNMKSFKCLASIYQ